MDLKWRGTAAKPPSVIFFLPQGRQQGISERTASQSFLFCGSNNQLQIRLFKLDLNT